MNSGTAEVLRELQGIVETLLGEYEVGEDIEITMDTTLYEDLQLESIDLVVLAGHLEARYGSQVNIAEFVATLELDELIELTVGQLVHYVVGRLPETRGLEPSAPETAR